MEETYLYQQIAESIRRQIVDGDLQPGGRLLSIRELIKKWNCTPGTIQRAFRELSKQGLIVSRPGKGTHVVDQLAAPQNNHLRKASIIHRADSFLLEVLTAGYSIEEVKQALNISFDRWQTIAIQPNKKKSKEIRFAGSHDLAIKWLCDNFNTIHPEYSMKPEYSGSLGGLISLSQGVADIAGSHLWDPENDTYNDSFIRRVFPGQKMAVITLAQRNLGFMVLPGNPKKIFDIKDLEKPDLKFVNRQIGSGTRVWFDIQLKNLSIDDKNIIGYQTERMTHSEVAQSVIEGKGDVGIGLEAVSKSFSLDFIPLTKEQFDLIIFYEKLNTSPFLELQQFLQAPEVKTAVTKLGGYECSQSGNIRIIE